MVYKVRLSTNSGIGHPSELRERENRQTFAFLAEDAVCELLVTFADERQCLCRIAVQYCMDRSKLCNFALRVVNRHRIGPPSEMLMCAGTRQS